MDWFLGFLFREKELYQAASPELLRGLQGGAKGRA